MAIDVVYTAYGRPAALALRDAVAAAKAGDPLTPVTVVVPSNHVGVASRRLLASGALGPVTKRGVGLAAVTFATTYRLAELLGAPRLAAAGKRPVSTPVLAAAARAELAGEVGLFAAVAEHPATESALVSTYRELRDLSVGALDALGATSARASEVVRLHRGVRARLAPAWSDEEDLLEAALAAGATEAAAVVGSLVIHLPDRLSRHSARLLTHLGRHVPTTLVVGRTGVTSADAEVDASLARLGVQPPSLDAFRQSRPSRVVERGRTTILTASDSDEEVRAAVRAVLDAVRAGTRLDRIAVLHASSEPYSRLSHDQLHAAGVATNGVAVVPLAARVAGRALLDLLALPAGGFRRQDVLAWLASAPIVQEQRAAPTAAWERISRDAKVVSGRDSWDARLVQLAQRERERAERVATEDDQPEWVRERAVAAAERALELRQFVLHVIDDLAAAAAAPRRWVEHSRWASGWLVRLIGDGGHRTDWPEAEWRAAERVEVAIERLGALDGLEGPVPLHVFTRTLELELGADLGREGRFGEGVLVGSVEMGIGLDLDLVVVLGLAEGTFPAPTREDSLVPDRERAATGGELGLRADRVERQHRHLLAALACSRRRVLCVPRGDLRRNADRAPSRWVLDLASELAESTEPWWAEDLNRGEHGWIRHIGSFDAGLRHLAVPATAQEHRLRSLLSGDATLTSTDDGRVAAGAEVIAARRSSAFTRFDGNLAGLPVPSPLDHVTSPTRLERWATCPHRHLVEDLLRATPVENPEEALTMTPLDRGNLVHEALERFLLDVLVRPEADRPAPNQPWTPLDRNRLDRIGVDLCDRYESLGLTGRPIFWRRDRRRILDDLARFLVEDSRHRHLTGTSPLAVELSFGLDDGSEAVTVELTDGRALRIRGRADRVDLGTDGTIHVVDYKTGSSKYTKLSEEDPIARGTRLQLPIYGLAGRLHRGDPQAPVRADYWFVTGHGGWKRIGYEITAQVLEHTVAALEVIVAGIEHGVFPGRPAPLASTANTFRIDCPVCDPDGLGTIERRAEWSRKRSDPAMAGYAQMAEPLDETAESIPT